MRDDDNARICRVHKYMMRTAYSVELPTCSFQFVYQVRASHVCMIHIETIWFQSSPLHKPEPLLLIGRLSDAGLFQNPRFNPNVPHPQQVQRPAPVVLLGNG